MTAYSTPCDCCGCAYCLTGEPQETYYAHGISGVTNGTCSTCDFYNTDPFELTRVGTSCVWTGDNTGGCAGGTPTLTINSDGSATYTIGGATYDTAAFDCEGSNTFTLTDAGTDCDDWPEEIVISPGAVDDCSACPDGAPAEFSLTLSGFTNDACTDCDNLNGTHILEHTSGCTWQKSITICGGTALMILGIDEEGGGAATFRIKEPGDGDVGVWQNLSPDGCFNIELTYVSDGSFCDGIPSSVTAIAA